ncbi:MAG: Ppx/GppA phosphatase family protein [Pseudomonadota bacterium]
MDRAVVSAGQPRPLDLHRSSAPPGPVDHVGVVDIGSNSVRLVVYDRLARAPLPRFNEKSMSRLGEGIDGNGGTIPAPAFARLIDTMGRFRAIADSMGVARVDVLGTEAIRSANNGPALIEAIRAATGFEVRVLSGEEEARFAGLGVVAGFYRPTGMVGDMGGGSVEIIEVVDDSVGDRHVSLPLGALPVTAMLLDDAKLAKAHVDELLRDRLPPMLASDAVFYAVGGGWRALANAHMAAVAAPVHVVHGYAIDGDDARAFAKELRRMPADEVQALPGIPSRRASTLQAAALVLERLLKRLRPDRVVFSALGLREGWLYSQLDEAERYRDALVEGARELGQAVARVPDFGAALVRWTDELFPGETDADRRLRVAACALSDVAWRDHPDLRALESFRRVLQFPFVGIEHRERVFLAAAVHARYRGNGDGPELEPVLALLTPSERRRAQILGRMMLLGHRLSASVPAILDSAELVIEAEQLRLVVREAARIPDGEAVQGRLDLLAKAIGVRKTVIETAG